MTADAQPPPAPGGTRLTWPQVPQRVRRGIEARLGSPVAVSVPQPTGFSPGLASRMRLGDGRRVFIKAISTDCTPRGPSIFRAEARVTAALPTTAPAPRFLDLYDDGDWVALMLEDIDGYTPAQPWIAAELDRVLEALGRMALELTPAPIDAPSITERWSEQFSGWRQLATPGGSSRLPEIDLWAADHLDQLTRWEAAWSQAARGSTLLHGDIRADNILLTADRVVFVDWPWACIGAPWVDLVLMLPSVAMQGGGDPEDIISRHPLSRVVDPDALTALLAAVTGFFLHDSLQPAPPGLPMLRAFQRAQGVVALAWLRRRLERRPGAGYRVGTGAGRS